MPVRSDSYSQTYSAFRWEIPRFYNIGADVCDRWANGNNLRALICLDGELPQYVSFDEVRRLTNKLANVLIGSGLAAGDRVAILLFRSPQSLIAHVAAFKAGLVSVCLSPLFSETEIEYRLSITESKVVITDSAGFAKLESIKGRLELRHVYVIGKNAGGDQLDSVLAVASDQFVVAPTRAHDPAVIAFTTGSEGPPKGVLHAHRSFLGALPTFELVHDGPPAAGDVYWTPADWSWLGGLFPVLAAWRYGMPVLIDGATRFDPYSAFDLMANYAVRHAFIHPTALKLMRSIRSNQPSLRLLTLLTGGETLGTEILEWARGVFGVEINEVYAQSECTGIAGNNTRLFPVRPGSLGRPIPGHDVRIVDQHGCELGRGQTGIIGVRQPDPAIFLEYWRDPVATKAKFAGEFLLTGDLATQDEQGYLWYAGRSDDLITTAGYRVSPSEIEDCIMKHPSVGLVGVVGVPDTVCTEAIKAWVVLKPGFSPSEDLARDIQRLVRSHLALHQYPRQIRFTDSLPMSANGKIVRRELRALH